MSTIIDNRGASIYSAAWNEEARYILATEKRATDKLGRDMQKARVAEGATLRLLDTEEEIGTAVLRALWNMYENGYYLHLGEYNSLREWATDKITAHRDLRTTTDKVLIIERVFQEVHVCEVMRKPFKDAAGKPITVERLFDEGKIFSMKALSAKFAGELDQDKREHMLRLMISGSRDEVELERDGGGGDGTKITLYYVIAHKQDGTRDLVFSDVNDDQISFVRAMMKGALKEAM